MRVKEESEKVGLKLNIQKTNIMASRPITSWQIEREKVESGNVRERNITEGEKQLIRDKRIPLDLATGNNWKSEDLIKVDKNIEH